MSGVLLAAVQDGSLRPPRRPLPGPRLVTGAVVDIAGGAPAAPYEDLLERSFVLLTALIGAVSHLPLGHLHGALLDEDAWFDQAMVVAAEGVGLELPLS